MKKNYVWIIESKDEKKAKWKPHAVCWSKKEADSQLIYFVQTYFYRWFRAVKYESTKE